MRLNPRLVGRALALFCATFMWPVQSLPAHSPTDPRLVGVELAQLGELNHALRQTLVREESRLEATCEFAAVRDRLIELRDRATAAIGRLGALWREGHLRNGGLALAEVLLDQLGGVVEEARRDIAVADTLAMIQAAGTEAKDIARRTAAVYPDLTCVNARNEGGTPGQARARSPR